MHIAALTSEQVTALRVVRGDQVPRYPFSRSQTRHQDQNLLVALMLVERHHRFFEITNRGADYLRRIDAEALSEDSGEPASERLR